MTERKRKWYESETPEPWLVEVRVVEQRTVEVLAISLADANRRARDPRNWQRVSDEPNSARILIRHGGAAASTRRA